MLELVILVEYEEALEERDDSTEQTQKPQVVEDVARLLYDVLLEYV